MRKNLTKTQIEVEELSKRVPKLTERQIEWAKSNFAYRIEILGADQRECVCPECKEKLHFAESKKTQTIRCPHCGAKVMAYRCFDSRGQKWTRDGVNYGGYGNHQEELFQVMSAVGDWQVTRLFYMQRWIYLRKDSTQWEFYEVCQAWNNPKYALTHFRSLPKKGMGYNYNPYCLHQWGYECTDTDNLTYNKYIVRDNYLEPRRAGRSNYFSTDNICPIGMTISKSFKKFGIDATAFRSIKTLSALSTMESISGKNYKPMYETLLKGRDYAVFDKVVSSNEKGANAYFTAVKICKRNNYDYKSNVTEWIDLISFVIKRGLDYHNPHYVCPTDIHEEHNRYLALERREEERREEERRRVRIEQMHEETKKDMENKEKVEKEFIKRRKMYFGLHIDGELFTIVPLKSIDEFRYEGTFLDHCVFRCGYYKKESSLILSARDAHNNPIETIEINLTTFTIMQCYGVHDTHSVLHDKIVKTMKDNMWKVKEICARKNTKAA